MKLYKLLPILILSLFLSSCNEEDLIVDTIQPVENIAIETAFNDIEFEEINALLIDILRDKFELEHRGLGIALVENFRHSFSRTSLTIDYGDINTSGWLVHALSHSRIPVWLASGIETFAMQKVGLINITGNTAKILADFGDRYFTPDNWGQERHQQAVLLSYYFVSWLYDNSLLEDVILAYIRTSEIDSNEILREHFYKFSGKELLTAVRFLPRSHEPRGFTVQINLEHSNFTFLSDRFIARRTISNLIDFSKSGNEEILYIKDFHRNMGFEVDDRPVDFEIFLSPQAGEFRAFARPEQAVMLEYDTMGFEIRMHEAWHVVTGRISEPFYPFDEGMANFIFRYYDIEIRGRSVDIFNSVHANANILIRSMESLGRLPYSSGGLIEELYPSSSRLFILELSTYATAESFTIYLIKTYGLEKFSQVYFDIDNFENVYGITLQEMVDEWLEFLNNLE